MLLIQGQRILEQLFPGLGAELTAAGAPTVDWIANWSMLGTCGWLSRFPSGLSGQTCSRNLLEWSIRHRLERDDRLRFLEGCQVTVAHMLKSPTALFQPNILAKVLWQAIGRVF